MSIDPLSSQGKAEEAKAAEGPQGKPPGEFGLDSGSGFPKEADAALKQYLTTGKSVYHPPGGERYEVSKTMTAKTEDHREYEMTVSSGKGAHHTYQVTEKSTREEDNYSVKGKDGKEASALGSTRPRTLPNKLGDMSSNDPMGFSMFKELMVKELAMQMMQQMKKQQKKLRKEMKQDQ